MIKRRRGSDDLDSEASPSSAEVRETQLDSDHRRKRGKLVDASNVDEPIALSKSLYLPVSVVGNVWHGSRLLANMVVFGDSYSKTDAGITWVDYLLIRLRENPSNSEIRILNFASPGATVHDDIQNQFSRFLSVLQREEDGLVPLDSAETTYVLFMGINDCGSVDYDEADSYLEKLMDTVHDLYVKAEARNFVFINLPPIHRSPQAVNSESSGEIQTRIQEWNDLLEERVSDFAADSKTATVFVFNAHRTLTEILDGPVSFGFSQDDAITEGGEIWNDDLHLTERVHERLANKIRAVLNIG